MSSNEDGAPEGYHYEWVTDNSWKLGTSYTKCRQPRCPNPPVAEFARYSLALKKSRPYAYCVEHLYGRRIMNGRIESRRLVLNREPVEV